MSSAVQAEYHTSGLVRLTRPQLIGTMLGLLLSVLLASLDQTIVGTAEPRIIAQLSGFDRYPWVSTTYLLTSTLAIPIFAKLSDIYGRKWFFLTGAGMFMLTSALCGASGKLTFLPIDGMSQLIVFRGLQGVGGGMMMGLAFTIIGDVFSPAERGRYQGFFAATYGLASIFGPTLGGWLTDHVSWRAVFYVNLPVGIIAIAAIWMEFPFWRPEGVKRSIDWAGVSSLILSIVPLLLALTWATDYGWGSARVDVLLVFAVVMLAAFIRIEGKAIEPLIPLVLFRSPVISMAAALSFILGIGMFGVIIYLPLFMQGVLGVSATQSGNLLTPLLLASVVGSILTGQINLRFLTYKPSAVAGSILIAAGMILFARMDATTQRVDVVKGMLIAGFGMGLLMPVYTVAIQNAASREHMGAASALPTFCRSIGSTVGVAVFGTVLLTNYQRDFAKGVPAGTAASLLKPFSNPLMLQQMRPQLDATFGQSADGLAVLKTLLENVRGALVHGINLIFISSTAIMGIAVVLNLLLRSVPLRHGTPKPEARPEM
ncbi:MAG TPA: MDR family MFS transporter [Bryobacteraceae bacterium]|jgi:EmrB/QacA subfamily drug resistance transporter|nr:MDR family MFS transporter [Bryobacteraceae bacterium]